VRLIGNSGIALKKRKLKKLSKYDEKCGKGSNLISQKIEKLKERIEILAKGKQKREENPYKIVISKNNNVKWLILIMMLCLTAGLFTPLGMVPYTYLYNTMLGETTQYIHEHLPLTLIHNLNFIIALMLFLAILIFTDTKIRLCDLFMLSGLVVLTFYSRRQESLFLIITVFILIRLINDMFKKYDPKGPEKLEKFFTKLAGSSVILIVVLLISFEIYRPKIGEAFVNEHLYPVQAADFILENLDIENIRLYNEYNYGAYLIYRRIPVFIDSRADLYAPEFNPGTTVFKDFINISGLRVDNIEELFDDYGITHLLMFSNARLRMFINQTPDRYMLIYNDGRFVIYERLFSNGDEYEEQEVLMDDSGDI